MDYAQQAQDFLDATGTKFTAQFKSHDYYFITDSEPRDIYRITLTRGDLSWTFRFGQSLVNRGIEPTAYDVLATLTKYDPGSYREFCADYGYDINDSRWLKTYKAVRKEWRNVDRMFGDVLEQLRDIA